MAGATQPARSAQNACLRFIRFISTSHAGNNIVVNTKWQSGFPGALDVLEHVLQFQKVKNMNRSKPFEILAVRFQTSRESAKYFLIRVQKSFKTEKPPHQLILDFMDEQNFELLPRPHRVATMMNESGVWPHPLHAEPPGLADEEDIYGE